MFQININNDRYKLFLLSKNVNRLLGLLSNVIHRGKSCSRVNLPRAGEILHRGEIPGEILMGGGYYYTTPV